MSILAHAAHIKRKKHLAEKTAEAEANKRRKEDRAEMNNLRDAVFKMVHADLHGKKGYSVIRVDGNFGELARINKKSEFKGQEDDYAGTVCITEDRFMWRGSDESPEQQGSRTVIYFARIINRDRLVETSLGDTWPRDKAIRTAVSDFRNRMAHYFAANY